MTPSQRPAVLLHRLSLEDDHFHDQCGLFVVDAAGVRSFRPFPPEPTAHCVFEHVYFARPDSLVFGRTVLESRLQLGRQLAREAPADADIVCPVPDSGMGAALGFAQESGLPFEWGLIRNHYVGRTFIQRGRASARSASRSS